MAINLSVLKSYINQLTDIISAERKSASNNEGIPEVGEYARSLEDFTIEELPDGEREVRNGKVLKEEFLDYGSYDNNEEIYAGKSVREYIENAKRNPRQPIYFGYAQTKTGDVSPVSIQFSDLFTHVAIFGSSGYGKSTTLKNLLLQLAYGGHGFMFTDPNGKDIKNLLRKIPEHRLDDVIYVELGRELSPEEHPDVTNPYQISFNFIGIEAEKGTREYTLQKDDVKEGVVEMLRSAVEADNFGATMETTVKVALRVLIEVDDRNYALTDLFDVIRNEETRKKLPELAKEAENPHLSSISEDLSNYDDDELQPLLKRFYEWLLTDTINDIISARESDITIQEIMDDDKILLVNTNNVPESIGSMFVSTFLRKMWSHKNQKNESESQAQSNPYFFAIDEFHKAINSPDIIETYLKEGRKYGLGLILSSQAPNQIQRDIRNEMNNNADSWLSFGLNDSQDANVIKNQIGIDKDAIQRVDKFKIYTKVKTNSGSKKGPFLVNSFPDYPPLRSEEEREQLIKESIYKYGSPKREIDAESVSNPLERATDEEIKETLEAGADDRLLRGYEIGTEGEQVSGQTLLKAIFNASLKKGGLQEYITKEEYIEELERFTRDNTEIDFQKVRQAITEEADFTTSGVDYVKTKDGKFTLGVNGISEIMPDGTGTSGSAGKEHHKRLLKKMFKLFATLGYTSGDGEVILPEQGGSEDEHDGLVEPPYRPYEYQRDKKRKQAKEKLQEVCPKGVKLFGYDKIAIETESTTAKGSPSQVMKNLRKSMENNRFCVYGVKQGEDSLTKNAERIWNVLNNPPGYKNSDEEGVRRWFYNHGNVGGIGQKDAKPLIKEDAEGRASNQKWKQLDDGRFHLFVGTEDESRASFDDGEQIKNTLTRYKYYYTKKTNEPVKVYKTGSDEIEAQYDTVKDMKDDGFKRVKQPYIPEVEFPDGEVPNAGEDYAIIITPIETDEYEYNFYRYDPTAEEKAVPIFESDPVEDIEGLEDENTTYTENDNETKTQEDEEVEVADPDSESKSTNDVVEESDEVWTKPDEGDDDYEPSKDNDKFRTGYDEEGVSENWTGGVARDEDKEEFENYTPPSEKETENKDKEPETDDTSEEESSEQDENSQDNTPDKDDESSKTVEKNEEDSEEETSKSDEGEDDETDSKNLKGYGDLSL